MIGAAAHRLGGDGDTEKVQFSQHALADRWTQPGGFDQYRAQRLGQRWVEDRRVAGGDCEQPRQRQDRHTRVTLQAATTLRGHHHGSGAPKAAEIGLVQHRHRGPGGGGKRVNILPGQCFDTEIDVDIGRLPRVGYHGSRTAQRPAHRVPARPEPTGHPHPHRGAQVGGQPLEGRVVEGLGTGSQQGGKRVVGHRVMVAAAPVRRESREMTTVGYQSLLG